MTKDIEEVLQEYTSLSLIKGEIIEGFLEANNEDRYFLKIDIKDFPTSFPTVWEINERIPRKPDRHINSDGTLCFTTQVHIEILLATQVKNLLDFVQLILIPYLQNNSYYEINKEYKFGEFSHNRIEAMIDTFREILNVKNIKPVLLAIHLSLNNIKLRPNDKCFCGSQMKIKNCYNHSNDFKKLKKISVQTLEESFKILKKIAAHNK